MDLEPEKEIVGCACPALQVVIKVCPMPTVDQAFPTGHTQHMVGALESQALASAPEAYLPSESAPMMDAARDAESEVAPEAPAMAMSEPMCVALAFGREGVRSEAPRHLDPNNAAVRFFTIDEEVYHFAPRGHVMTKLQDFQERNTTGPFDSAPYRSCNMFGCGFEPETNKYAECYLWPGMAEDSIPQKTAECAKALGRLVLKEPSLVGARPVLEWSKQMLDRAPCRCPLVVVADF